MFDFKLAARITRILLLTAFLTVCFRPDAGGLAGTPPPDELPPPADPREFHEQEMLRYQMLRERDVLPVLTSQADFDVFYYHLQFDLRAFYDSTLWGHATVAVRSLVPNLNEVVLNLCNQLTVDSVLVWTTPRPFTHQNNILTVALDRSYNSEERVECTVYYHGTPCRTNIFPSFQFFRRSVGWWHVPTVMTLSEPYGSPDWWPCKDNPADKADSVRIAIIVADTLRATSNGILESEVFLPPSSKIYTWVERYPISNYLISVCASNYVFFREWYVSLSGDSMPIDHYPYPERLWQARESWNVLPAMMAFYAQKFGEYPFVNQKYGHTMVQFSGAMEHQCNTSYGRSITNGQHNYDYIVLHELAHQYWGDEVTLATWPDIWLNEGFASYSEALWFEHLEGPARYREYMTSPSGLDVVDPSGPVYNPTELFDANTVYDKGAWILHILRGVVRNDSLFFAALAEYRHRHQYGNATTAQFLQDVSDVVGYDVTPYLSSYLYLTNRPLYEISYGSDWVQNAWRTVVRIEQEQTDPRSLFRTRLDLRFTGATDSSIRRVENSQWSERYYFNLGFLPTSLQLDPDQWVLKRDTLTALPLTILTAELHDGYVGIPYGESLLATGGSGGIHQWSFIAGDIPPGLTITEAGLVSGTPLVAGEYQFYMRVVDGADGRDKYPITLRIRSPLPAPAELTAAALPSGDLVLHWRRVPGASAYRVYRATSYDMLDMLWIGTTADTFAVDQTVPMPGDPEVYIPRYYFVTAIAE